MLKFRTILTLIIVATIVVVAYLIVISTSDRPAAQVSEEKEAPRAIAGIVDSRVSLKGGGVAHLVGEASFDPDGGELANYTWRVLESPIEEQIGRVVSSGLTANAPDQSYEIQSVGRWVYELEITDDEGARSKAQLVVHVQDVVTAITEPEKVLVEEVDFLEPDDALLGVVLDGQAVAYPAKVVFPHAVVNDTVSGEPIYIVYCEACQSGSVKRRQVDEQTLTFTGFGGTLEEEEFLYNDEETGSTWHIIYGEAKTGELEGVMLEDVDFELKTWSEWQAGYPHSLVLKGEKEPEE